MMDKQTFQQHSHCSYCGRPYGDVETWPRRCDHCGHMTFQNPTPVVVLLQPVDAGVLTVRRNIRPQVGELALPGGYVDMGESWREAAARELFEEAEIKIDAGGIVLFDVVSVPRNVLIFGVAPRLSSAQLPVFRPNDEVSERVIVGEPVALAFPAHTAVLERFLMG